MTLLSLTIHIAAIFQNWTYFKMRMYTQLNDTRQSFVHGIVNVLLTVDQIVHLEHEHLVARYQIACGYRDVVRKEVRQ